MKYVIELEEYVLMKKVAAGTIDGTSPQMLYKAKNFNSLVFDENGLKKLTPLPSDCENNDAWQFARKVVQDFNEYGWHEFCQRYNIDEKEWDYYTDCLELVFSRSYKEAKRQYKKAQKKALKEHDGCEECKHKSEDYNGYGPCRLCKRVYKDMYECGDTE